MKREITLDKDIAKSKEKYFYISSLSKVIKVLELLAERSDLSVTEVRRNYILIFLSLAESYRKKIKADGLNKSILGDNLSLVNQMNDTTTT